MNEEIKDLKLGKLAMRMWMAVLKHGGLSSIGADDVEPDGRKRKGRIKELVGAGVLIEQKVTLQPSGRDHVRFEVSRKWAEGYCAAERPDLAVLDRLSERNSPMDDFEKMKGPCLDKLNVPQMRFLAEHKGEYKFFDAWGRPVADLDDYYRDVFVTDAAYEAVVAAKVRARKIEYATGHNLDWGLRQAGLIEPADEDIFKSSAQQGFFGHDTSYFGPDPDKWPRSAVERIVKLRESIAKKTRELNALVELEHAMEANGGWEKFLDGYKRRIVEEIDK